MAAMGEPLITRYEPSQPKPSSPVMPPADRPLSTGFRPPAPDFKNSSARMKIASAATT